MGRRIHKVVTYGEKKGNGSARRRERRLTLSLACVAGDSAASAVVFLAAEPREDWEQVKEGYSLASTRHVAAPPPRKHHGYKNSASYAGYIIIHTTP